MFGLLLVRLNKYALLYIKIEKNVINIGPVLKLSCKRFSDGLDVVLIEFVVKPRRLSVAVREKDMSKVAKRGSSLS